MDLSPQILDKVKEFFDSLPTQERAKILAAITILKAGHTGAVITRQISGSIRELKVKQYRVLYFKHKNALFFVGGFTKKSRKTPPREIENAKQVQKLVTTS